MTVILSRINDDMCSSGNKKYSCRSLFKLMFIIFFNWNMLVPLKGMYNTFKKDEILYDDDFIRVCDVTRDHYLVQGKTYFRIFMNVFEVKYEIIIIIIIIIIVYKFVACFNI